MFTLITLSHLMFFALSTAHSDNPLTTKEVPLYMRQSWNEMVKPYRSLCISETKVNPNYAFKSTMFTEIPNDSRLKCYYKCLCVKLNLMEATTGEFVGKEFLRQVEGVTPEIFKKCNDELRCETDLCRKCFDMYMCIVHSVAVLKSHHPPKPCHK